MCPAFSIVPPTGQRRPRILAKSSRHPLCRRSSMATVVCVADHRSSYQASDKLGWSYMLAGLFPVPATAYNVINGWSKAYRQHTVALDGRNRVQPCKWNRRQPGWYMRLHKNRRLWVVQCASYQISRVDKFKARSFFFNVPPVCMCHVIALCFGMTWHGIESAIKDSTKREQRRKIRRKAPSKEKEIGMLISFCKLLQGLLPGCT